jgi:PAS domain S-box-containing protein
MQDHTIEQRPSGGLEQVETTFRQLLEGAPDAMVVSDSTGRIVLANVMAERAFGYGRDELIGQSIEVLVPKRYRHMHTKHRHSYSAAPRPRYMGEGRELFAARKDGSEFPVEISLSPMTTGGGLLVISAVRDISERKLAQQSLERQASELARSNAELEQFAYVASHDLQEPLRMVASYSQLLERRYRGKLDSDADEFIEFIVDGATRMQALINDLLAYSRVGTRGKEFESTDCNQVVNRALENLQAAIEEAGAEISVGPLPTLSADGSQLVQLFQNLISNALKFRGDEPPRIEIDAKVEDGNAVFSVHDHGIGMEPQYADRIFLLFQRLHTKKDYKGTGIGLAICKKIVERHGGRIWVESQLGEGATFFFTIPLRQE